MNPNSDNLGWEIMMALIWRELCKTCTSVRRANEITLRGATHLITFLYTFIYIFVMVHPYTGKYIHPSHGSLALETKLFHKVI